MFNDRFGLTQAVLEGRKTQTRRIAKRVTYKPGDVVAVAQSYHDCGGLNEEGIPRWDIIAQAVGATDAGWNNKMFVRADLMPHQIRITNVYIQRLQDISDEDCLKEGIYPYYYGDEKEKRFYEIPPDGYSFDGTDFHYPTPHEAFVNLIDKVSGKGTWERNPYVWVYDFELIK